MYRKVVPMGKVLKYYVFTAAFVIAVFLFSSPCPGYSIHNGPATGHLYLRITNISRPYDPSGSVTALPLVVNTSAINRALE